MGSLLCSPSLTAISQSFHCCRRDFTLTCLAVCCSSSIEARRPFSFLICSPVTSVWSANSAKVSNSALNTLGSVCLVLKAAMASSSNFCCSLLASAAAFLDVSRRLKISSQAARNSLHKRWSMPLGVLPIVFQRLCSAFAWVV